jgi:hypothetical protein
MGLLWSHASRGLQHAHCKPQLVSHPAFGASLQTLRAMSVRVLFDPDAPYERRLPSWCEVIDALPVRAGTG